MLQVFENYASVFLTISCIVAALFYFASYVKKRAKLPLPPGPVGFPIVGYLPFLTKMQHLKFAELATKHGNVFSMRLGSDFVVVLNTSRIIKEAFSKPEFLGRRPFSTFKFVEDFESAFFSNGRAWQEQRRFSMRTMKDLGFGKCQMEKNILDEIEYFVEEITKCGAMPIDITKKLTPSMSNNICSLVFGQRYKYDDPRRIFLDRTVDILLRSVPQLSPYGFFPWLKNVPFIRHFLKVDFLAKHIEDFRMFIREHIDEHDKTLDPDNIRDYIDGYIDEMKMRLKKDPDTTFSYNMLTGSVVNFFGAGSETVRTAVTWCLYTMAEFQDVQKKVQDEIDKVIGNDKVPSFQDQKEMPFTQAVLAEVQRWKPVLPLGVMRYTLGDTELQGYHIPKGAVVIANFYSAHHDPEEWENPDDFRPDRFLNNSGTSFIKREGYMPFSTGKRSCPGEILAIMEVFLYFTSILQKFTVETYERQPVDFEGILEISYRPKLHMLCFKSRS